MWLALLYMLCFQARAVAHASPYRFTWNVVDSSRRKIVEVGMPKSGTSSLQDLLQTLGVKSVHYSDGCVPCESTCSPTCVARRLRCYENPSRNHEAPCSQQFVGWQMYLNRGEGKMLFDGWLEGYQAYAQIDRFGFGDPNNTVALLRGSSGNAKLVPLFPQVGLLEDIHTQYPETLFVLSVRDPVDWANSVLGWADGSLARQFAANFTRSQLARDGLHYPATGPQAGSRATVTVQDLTVLYEEHTKRTTALCAARHMHCVTVQLDNATHGFDALLAALGEGDVSTVRIPKDNQEAAQGGPPAPPSATNHPVSAWAEAQGGGTLDQPQGKVAGKRRRRQRKEHGPHAKGKSSLTPTGR